MCADMGWKRLDSRLCISRGGGVWVSVSTPAVRTESQTEPLKQTLLTVLEAGVQEQGAGKVGPILRPLFLVPRRLLPLKVPLQPLPCLWKERCWDAERAL